MAGSAYVAAGSLAQSAGAATLTPAKPAVLTQNGVLIAVVWSKNNATHVTATSGWTKIGATLTSGASFCASIFIAPESAVAPVITWTGSVACAARVYYRADPANVSDGTGVGTSSNANGLTSTHTSASITTTRDNHQVMYIDVAAANTALAQPSGWTEDLDAAVATAVGRIVVGSKEILTAGASGAISVTGANAAWIQWQIEILSEAPGPADWSKVEGGVWEEPVQDQLSVGKVEAGVWVVPNDNQNRYSKVEAGVWLVAAISRRPKLLYSSL